MLDFFATYLFAGADAVIHVNYIKPLHECHPDTNEICDNIRDINNCLPGEDTRCIGERYWKVLPSLFLILAIIVGSIRILIGKMAGHEFNGMLILIGFLWFITIIIFPYTGWADYFYYVIIDEPVPEVLPWLNDNYLLTVFDIGGDPNNVICRIIPNLSHIYRTPNRNY